MKLGKFVFPSRGIGLVAMEDIEPITNLGEYLIKGITPTEDTKEVWDGWVETPILGRYLNHNKNANTFPILKGKDIFIYTNRKINRLDEITVNYFDVANLIDIPPDKLEELGVKDFEYKDEIIIEKNLEN
jgi:hypothetical protein